MDPVILKNIVKTYGRKKNILAVNDISLNVKKGELFGLIGPDGAGKTSLFRILTTLLLPDSGTATVEGFDTVKDYKKIRNIVGYMPGRFSLYQDLSVEENLAFFATVFNTTINENYKLIKDIYVQIEPFKKRRAGKLSGGMKQKLALCCALIHKPVILFLDEPTTGVDPVSRKEFWEILKRLKAEGITIVVATPYMDEANLCDRIALFQNGKILSIDTPLNITAAFPDKLFAASSNNMSSLIRALKENTDVNNSYSAGEYVHISADRSSNVEVETLKKYLESKDIKEITVKKIEATVEDSFIKLLK